jgi:DNA-binding GntR family transcriptional regulator
MAGMSARSPATPVIRRALQDEVYDAVLAMLLGGEIAPGRPVGIDSLAMRLGVSQTPVREALARLEGTSLIERSAMRGYRVVSPMDPGQVREYFDARVLVEVAAAKRAYAHREHVVPALTLAALTHAELVRGLALSAEAQVAAPGARAVLIRRCMEADMAFHRVLGEHCDNRYLRDMTGLLATSPLRMTRLATLQPAEADRTVAEHDRITRAFADGSREEAQDAVRRHVLAARDRVLAEPHRKAHGAKAGHRDVARDPAVRKTGPHE